MQKSGFVTIGRKVQINAEKAKSSIQLHYCFINILYRFIQLKKNKPWSLKFVYTYWTFTFTFTISIEVQKLWITVSHCVLVNPLRRVDGGET